MTLSVQLSYIAPLKIIVCVKNTIQHNDPKQVKLVWICHLFWYSARKWDTAITRKLSRSTHKATNMLERF